MKPKKITKTVEPLMTSSASEIKGSATSLRRNKSGVIERTDKFTNIDNGLIPFKFSNNYSNKSNLDIRDAVILCQKAYYNFAVFRNVIDLMTEFSVSSVYYREGSKKSRDFFDALFKKINVWSLQDKFFREYFRSGNVFFHRFDAKLSSEDFQKITQTFGSEEKVKTSTKVNVLEKDNLHKLNIEKMAIPSRYIILNPADIQVGGTLSFSNTKYYKLLSDYELERLRNPQSDEDLEVVDALPEDVKLQLKDNRLSSLMLPLDPSKIIGVFYKKQDYEPFAVPMGYPVLEDINFKCEMRKMDMAIARTMQQAILLVTMGAEPEKGGVSQKNLEAMQKLFENQSVGRVLIADYTTKAEFIIPQIADLLDPKKYEIIDKDINLGLNNIFAGGEKFSNQQAKLEVFMGRLKQARETFLNEFLIPEIKRIAKSLGFKNFPIPYFEEISLKDDPNTARIYTRLIELGVLTPEEGIVAIETGKLPDKEMSMESQKEFKEHRDNGYYLPVIGGNKAPEEGGKPSGNPFQSGRPSGVKAPQTTKKISPIGAREQFGAKKIKENFLLAQKVEDKIVDLLKKKHKIKKLNDEQNFVAAQITQLLMSNERPENWLDNAENYCKNPSDVNKEQVEKIQNIALEHGLDIYLSSILYASKID